MQVIDRFDGEYRWLSNFAPSPLVGSNGKEYATVEHAYQACKAADEEGHERIRLAATPGQAKRLGRQVALRKDWEALKLGLMTRLIRKKFAAGSELAAKLLATGDAELVEGNSWGDRYWGVCNGRGENQLGRILMMVREELKGEPLCV